jgi:hypothetical protein
MLQITKYIKYYCDNVTINKGTLEIDNLIISALISGDIVFHPSTDMSCTFDDHLYTIVDVRSLDYIKLEQVSDKHCFFI